jgi:laminin alpha 3/5
LLQNGQFYEAKLPTTLCPSNSGCRSVIKQASGNQVFQIQENFVLTLKSPANKTAWVDYVYVVPADEYTPALLEESPIDLTAEFIARCGRNNFQVDRNTPDFCRQAIFTLTTEFNSGALPCQCDFQGSLSFECDPFGGQCPCKSGVIGRQCTRCQTGYFGFPDCKPCDCPSTALCDPASGSCICPPRVTGTNQSTFFFKNNLNLFLDSFSKALAATNVLLTPTATIQSLVVRNVVAILRVSTRVIFR